MTSAASRALARISALLSLLASAYAPAHAASLERVEVVAHNVSTGDGGNSWGAHKLRIVRIGDELYTSYATGAEYLTRDFRLARRTSSGWQTVLEGPGGREPANLLAAPDGTLRLIAWPQGLPVMLTGVTAQGREFRREAVPGQWARNDWPYHGAAISPSGALYIVTSYGDTPGGFRLAFQRASNSPWEFQQFATPYRHCYAIAFARPSPGGESLSWIAVRDILWAHLGWKAPPGAFRYLFNGLQLFDWRPDSQLHAQPLREEPQTPEFLSARCTHSDAYLDTSGRLHVLYELRGASTLGRTEGRHLVLDRAGKVLKDVALPHSGRWRILQNANGVFYLVVPSGGSVAVYRALSADGTELAGPQQFDLKTAGIVDHLFLTLPRAGVPLADFVDGVFLSAEQDWIYFRLRLP